MAYYSQLKLRGAPLHSNVITPDALKTVLNLPIGGGGYRSLSLGFSSHKIEEDYKGFCIPRYVKFYLIEHDKGIRHDFFACLIAEQVDLLLQHPTLAWPDWQGDTLPTQADWDAVFVPVTDPQLQRKAEEIFAAILEETAGQKVIGVTDAEKLAAVQLRPVSEERLARLAQLMTGHDPKFGPLIEALVHSAYNPAGYLKDTGKVQTMTLDGCKHFSWYRVFKTGMRKANRLAFIDWKFGAEDVAYIVAGVLGQPFAFKRAPEPDAMGYDLVKAAQDQLWRPGLFKKKQALIMLGDEGDSVAFTIVPKSAAKEVVALAEELGLKPEGPA